jgi:tetratricopeptide (TPR) repeat protein
LSLNRRQRQLSTMTQDPAIESIDSQADLLARAEVAAGQSDYDEALRLWSEARMRFPDVPRPWLRIAEVQIALRRFIEAEQALDEAVCRFPDHFWLLRAHALVVRSQGDDVEAYTRYRALRQAFPDNPAAHADLVHLLLDLKEAAVAEAEAEASIALFPDHNWLRHMYARCADQAGETAVAAARWIDLLARHPGHEPAYAPAVSALISAGRVGEAEGIATEGLRLLPNSRSIQDAWAKVNEVTGGNGKRPSSTELAEDVLADALCAERQAQWPEAARLWALLREQAPALALAYAGSARVLLRLDRAAEAEIVLARARRDLPPDAGVLEVWANAAVQRGDFEHALSRFCTLRRAFATSSRATSGIARALHALGRLDEADAEYANLCEDQPWDLSLTQQYALIASERCHWPEAVQRWKQITVAFPDDLLAYWHLADALRRADRWTEADAVLGEAVDRFPDDLETALRWIRSGQNDGSSRLDLLCRRFPDVSPVIRPQPSFSSSAAISASAASQ